ncbi:TPA: tagaturonate reductase [Escherichia coli]
MDNAILENILRQVRPLIGQGKVADYIPALATVDGSRLGIAICTVDGQLFQAGDAQERFSIQSISKVLSLVVAMRHYSEEEIWQRVGKDPSGSPFNSLVQLEMEQGIPRNPFNDGFLDTAEHFYLFVIQGPKSLATELRLDKYPLNVLIVDDIKPYKERKVAILNGAHTALVPVAFQAGLDTVGEAMNDAEICAFVEKAIYEEIIPVLDLPRDELESFASAVTGRFRNPYIKHQLLSIALNGMTKFRTRILPQLLAGQKANGTLPARLTFALAALIAFYRGVRNGETYPVQDDAHWLERYQQLWSQYRDRVIGTQELVAIVLAEKDHWEQDLTQVPGLVEQVANDLDAILEKGMREAVRPLC